MSKRANHNPGMVRVLAVLVLGFAACLVAAALLPVGTMPGPLAGGTRIPDFVNRPLAQGATGTGTGAAMRDVTAAGMTPGPKVTGPLVTVAAPEPPAAADQIPAPISAPTARIVSAPPGATPAAAERQQRLFRPVITAAGAIETAAGTVHLGGIRAPAADERCGADDWPCGAMARAALRQLVRGRAVDCELPDGADTLPDPAHCSIAGADIAAWLVAQGWAKADGLHYADAEKQARNARLGVWAETRPGPQPAEVAALAGPADLLPEARLPESSPASDLLINDRVSGTP